MNEVKITCIAPHLSNPFHHGGGWELIRDCEWKLYKRKTDDRYLLITNMDWYLIESL